MTVPQSCSTSLHDCLTTSASPVELSLTLLLILGSIGARYAGSGSVLVLTLPTLRAHATALRHERRVTVDGT
ncbi:hypothetical protein H257_08713 [Aphanomyces astaci]|uniref:Uncharacterized protein n=1 Tax=Aphanomyces astaci TaxID=112090 RepID=W4GC47_APHAT|nr:hypothetical protein H257_08713 [Aphanomyces astaci]ETV77257.1 hypothetical protein H257_08713 [Aphanomyces astaci]|eukprot:XP_009833044.1 hypothetical protein H257_08713 [Aphanomyces astaci]